MLMRVSPPQAACSTRRWWLCLKGLGVSEADIVSIADNSRGLPYYTNILCSDTRGEFDEIGVGSYDQILEDSEDRAVTFYSSPALLETGRKEILVFNLQAFSVHNAEIVNLILSNLTVETEIHHFQAEK